MSDLKNKFIKFMNQYSDELDEARKTQDFKRPLRHCSYRKRQELKT